METKAILAQPGDHRGILGMSEAVKAMLEAFRTWAHDPLLGELRRRTHTPKNVRITLHQGGTPEYGMTGIMVHAELVRIFGDKQRYPRRGRPVLVLYNPNNGALKLILIGEMHPKELPTAKGHVGGLSQLGPRSAPWRVAEKNAYAQERPHHASSRRHTGIRDDGDYGPRRVGPNLRR